MLANRLSISVLALTSMVSFGSLADYAPKVFIDNQNEPSTVGAATGVKAIVNNVELKGTALYALPGETILVGQLGVEATDIAFLDVKPSKAGEGFFTGWGKKTVYPLSDTLDTLYHERSEHPNQDILITITNPWSHKGYWAFEFSWRDRIDSSTTTNSNEPAETPKKPGPKHKPAKVLAFRKPVEIKQVTKRIEGQNASSMAEVIIPESVQKELNAAILKRKQGAESGEKK